MIATPQLAFLLHSRPYKENQLLLDFITEHDGRISAITYTGNKLKTSKKALFQPFSPLHISFSGKSALKKITLAESAGKSFHLQNTYLYSGFYINELLIRLLPETSPCSVLFQSYLEVLEALKQQADIEIQLRSFELVLLDELGVSLDFSEVYHHQADYFYYLFEEGFVPAINKLSQPCYDKRHLQAIAEQQLSPEVLYTFKRLMRQVLSPLLGHKPLNSRKLFIKR